MRRNETVGPAKCESWRAIPARQHRGLGLGAPPLGLAAPPLSQAAPLQQGRRALHWRRLTSLRHFPGAMSRRGHNQLSALKPLFGVACPLWWNKEVDARQHLHGLPPMIGWCVSDQNHILASSRPSHGMSRRGGPRRYARQWDYKGVSHCGCRTEHYPEFFGGEPLHVHARRVVHAAARGRAAIMADVSACPSFTLLLPIGVRTGA
jgi:hypothetical protein